MGMVGELKGCGYYKGWLMSRLLTVPVKNIVLNNAVGVTGRG